ncbi:MAG: hypothetical protein AMXMBFR22_16830 [Phycisphaerae bacterium]
MSPAKRQPDLPSRRKTRASDSAGFTRLVSQFNPNQTLASGLRQERARVHAPAAFPTLRDRNARAAGDHLLQDGVTPEVCGKGCRGGHIVSQLCDQNGA